MDLKLQDGVDDLLLVNGDLQITSGLDATAQRLRISLRFFLGDWFLDLSAGIPYFESVFIKNPSLPVVNYILTRAILRDAAVIQINKFDLDLDRASRVATVDFRADTVDGPVSLTEELRI